MLALYSRPSCGKVTGLHSHVEGIALICAKVPNKPGFLALVYWRLRVIERIREHAFLEIEAWVREVRTIPSELLRRPLLLDFMFLHPFQIDQAADSAVHIDSIGARRYWDFVVFRVVLKLQISAREAVNDEIFAPWIFVVFHW